MHQIRILRPDDVDRFCEFLRAVQVQVEQVEGAVVTATLPGAPSELHERRELGGYVTTWNALNPASCVEIAE